MPTVRLSVNGLPVSVQVEPATLLVDLLRGELAIAANGGQLAITAQNRARIAGSSIACCITRQPTTRNQSSSVRVRRSSHTHHAPQITFA